MNDLFNMIITTIKYRFSAIFAKLRYWTNASFIKAKFLSKFSEWLKSLFNVKPRHKADYYSFMRIMVSKKLVHTCIICVGLICLGYLIAVRPLEGIKDTKAETKVYDYDSFLLKFQNAKVSIKAESGYIAYIGDVKSGYAQGQGELYNRSGTLVYNGEFSKNKYEGTGKLYYPSGQLLYEGQFEDNLYQGTGKLYRENGMLLYSGDFDDGYREGNGELYSSTGNKIFAGTFQNDRLLYTQLLDKTTQEIGQIYTGEQKIYANQADNIVSLEEIDTLYVTSNGEESVQEDVRTTTVYVLSNTFGLGDVVIENVEELKKEFGQPNFEGNTYINFYDAVAIAQSEKKDSEIQIDPQVEYSELYEEYLQVSSYDNEALMYLYMYEMDGLNYSFVTDGKKEQFFMYIISK